MVDVFKARSFAADSVIIREGDPGDSAYLIEHGEVEVYCTTDDGKLVLGTVGAGGIFGEMALIDAKPRMASVRATRKTTCVEIDDKVFQAVMSKADPILRGQILAYVRNLRNLSSRMTEMDAFKLLNLHDQINQPPSRKA
jgi:CRP/FNR family cyclic AMP-dependent transcriptional regulator